MNLDGGGSRTLWVRGAIVNYPSDRTGERPVGNALWVVTPGRP
jgi:exopolysaccharide biosynthesis protein